MLVRLLAQSGFRVECNGLDYRHAIPKDKYFRMVEACYMSVLSSFSPEEIREGLLDRSMRDPPSLEATR